MTAKLNTIDDWFKYYDENKNEIINLMESCHPNRVKTLTVARNKNDYYKVFKLIQDCWLDVNPTLHESKGYNAIVTLLGNSIY